MSGSVLTIDVSAAAIVLGLVLGLIGAAARMSPLRSSALAASVYVEVIRNTPVLVQLFILYFGLPELGSSRLGDPGARPRARINNGAYLSEIFRGGLQAVPRGQLEAAAAIAPPARATFGTSASDGRARHLAGGHQPVHPDRPGDVAGDGGRRARADQPDPVHRLPNVPDRELLIILTSATR